MDPLQPRARVPDWLAPAARPRGFALYAAAAAVASLVWLTPHLLHVRQVPDGGDPVFSAWRLARFAHQLATDPAHLFDGNIFHPAELTLAYSDATILQGLAAAPFLLLGADPLVVSNLLFLAAFPLNAAAFFYAGWRLTADPRVGVITGIAGSLNPFHVAHYSHLELQYVCFIPLAVIALLELLGGPTARRGAWLGALISLQWLASMYLGLMLLTFLVPFGAVIALGWRVRPSAAVLRALGTAAAIVVATVGAVSIPYLRSEHARGPRTLALAAGFSAFPSEYGHPAAGLASYQWISRVNNRQERELFPGLMTLGAAAAGILPPLGAVRAATLVSGAAAFDWSRGPFGLSYGMLYRWIRPYRGIRVPARFGVFVGTALVLLGSYGCARMVRAASRARLGGAAATIIAAAFMLDLRIVLQLRDYWTAPPAIYATVTPDMVLAEFPWNRPFDYMYFSTTHWARLLNGYSGSTPEAYFALERRVETFPSPEAIDAVRAAGATHLTFNCRLEPRKYRCPRTLDLLDANPALERVAGGTWEGEPVRLYRFRER
jgi:hypothetical protein